jgi:hypothetical protein
MLLHFVLSTRDLPMRLADKFVDPLHIASHSPTFLRASVLCLYCFISRPSALQVLAAEVRAAKQEGKYSEGVNDLPGTDV